MTVDMVVVQRFAARCKGANFSLVRGHGLRGRERVNDFVDAINGPWIRAFDKDVNKVQCDSPVCGFSLQLGRYGARQRECF